MSVSPSLAEVVDALVAACPQGAEPEASLVPFTTYRVGGPAAVLVRVESVDDLRAVMAVVRGTDVPVRMVGRGSNLLVADRGFRGVAVHLGAAFAEVHIDETVLVAGAAAKLPVVARTSVQAGLGGFEWAVGVPGSVGGAVVMNAGGHGAEIADSLLDAHIVDLRTDEDRVVPAEALELSYRHSNLRTHDLVVGARFQLAHGDPDVGRESLSEIVSWRRDNQPGGQNAGSVFTNPPGDSAGRLIDAAGLKGFRIGTAEVSTKHANFIQVDDNGRADDVRAVMDAVVAQVLEATGVTLHPETHLVGFDHDITGSEERK